MLTECGQQSYSALTTVLSTQLLPMAYPYYELKVPTDLPYLVFSASTGLRSFTADSALKIPLQPGYAPAVSVSHASTYSFPHTLPQTYNSSLPHLYPSWIPPLNNENNENDAVEITKMDENTVSKDDVSGMESEYTNETHSLWCQRARQWWATVRETDVIMNETVAIAGIESFAAARQTDTRLTQSDFHRWLTISRLIAVSEGSIEINQKHWDHMRELESIRLDRISNVCSEQI